MKEERKTRADAKLKTLPEQWQQQIVDFARDHTLAETAAWLREDGIETSVTGVSLFLNWFKLNAARMRNESTTQTLLEQLKVEVPGLSESQIDEIGQRTFSLLTLADQDLDGFVKIRTARSVGEIEKAKLELRRQAEVRQSEKLQFEKRKWVEESCGKILAAATDAKTREIAAMQVPNEEKIRLLRQHWFSDVDELEQSGQVEIPPVRKAEG